MNGLSTVEGHEDSVAVAGGRWLGRSHKVVRGGFDDAVASPRTAAAIPC